jgi:phenol/toluene 2-monooxygenase (NADH) P3/A3
VRLSDYHAMTRGLMWEPSYVDKKEIFFWSPEDEGLLVHDPSKWQDPFRMTCEQYASVQGQKDEIYHAVRQAFETAHNHAKLLDGRWIECLKPFLSSFSTGEYFAGAGGFSMLARYFPSDSTRFGALNQVMDERRHEQTQVAYFADLALYYDGFHAWHTLLDNHWVNAVVRTFFEDLTSRGPIESAIGLAFVFEVTFSNILFMPFGASAAAIGDMAYSQLGKTVQSDETRHMSLGTQTMQMMLKEDPANRDKIQEWVDKYWWRCWRVFLVMPLIMDYYPSRRVMSFREAAELYIDEQVLDGMLKQLERYGIRAPKHAEDSRKEYEFYGLEVYTLVRQAKNLLYFRVPRLTDEDVAWLAEKYPVAWPHFEEFYARERAGDDPSLLGLPALCQTCKAPICFRDPDHFERLWIQHSTFGAREYHFCSPGCKDIFDSEPERYAQHWMPVDAILAGEAGSADPKDLFRWWGFDPSEGGEYYGSRDHQRWLEYRRQLGIPTPSETHAAPVAGGQ